MDVSPKTLREVEFREKMRGYHPEDVDQFLEQVAAGLEVLQDRLRQAVERAQRAEAAASDAGGNDETIRRTLVLAQRTADLAVQEAREQAARILAGAEQQAQAVVGEAEERARRILEDAVASSRTEVAKLESSRAQAQQEVDALNRWVGEHKAHLSAALGEALAIVERAGVLSPPPSSRPIEVALPPRPQPAAGAAPAPAGPPPSRPAPSAPAGPPQAGPGPAAPAAGSPSGGAPAAGPAPTGDAEAGSRRVEEPPEGDAYFPGLRSAAVAAAAAREEASTEQALDDFFDDSDGEGDDRRFGGRLRRRR